MNCLQRSVEESKKQKSSRENNQQASIIGHVANGMNAIICWLYPPFGGLGNTKSMAYHSSTCTQIAFSKA